MTTYGNTLPLQTHHDSSFNTSFQQMMHNVGLEPTTSTLSASALPSELIVHKYVASITKLVFTYPQRLDASHKTHCPSLCVLFCLVGLRCHSLRLTGLNLTKAVLLGKLPLHIYPSPAHIKNRTLAVRPIVWEWYVGNCKTSYRCPL